MPFSRTIHPDVNLLYIRGEGVVDRADLVSLQESLIHSAAEAQGRDQIVDLTLVARIDLSIDDISALRPRSEALRRATQPGRLAIVAPSDITFGLARMYEMMFEESQPPREILVVRSIREATSWLNLPEPESWSPTATT
jgi:hypothetical protein